MRENIEFEKNKAWFVDELKNILWCLDLETNKCEYIAQVPCSSSDKFRLHPKCIKNEDMVFCMPDKGDNIWVYDLKSFKFEDISIENIDKVRLLISDFWKYKNKLFAVSRGLKKIIQIDMDKKVIDNYYTIGNLAKGELTRSIMVGSVIYCLFDASNNIYQFNLETKEIVVDIIPKVEGGLYTICFDGSKFWLCGYHKEFYVWDKKTNSVEILTNFPKQFGIYDFLGDKQDILDCETTIYETPTFAGSVSIGSYIWFIPCQTNEILYINKNTYKINVFKITSEDETRESLLKNYVNAKYYTEYILGNRYIGLFSFNSNCIVEIDTLEKKSRKKICLFSNQLFEKISFDFRLFYEGDIAGKIIFNQFLHKVFSESKKGMKWDDKIIQGLQDENSVGEVIYNQFNV